jgi:hypothetical protein
MNTPSSPPPKDARRAGAPLAWWRVALLYLAAVLVGLGSAWAVLRSPGGPGEAAGPWRVSLLAGSADADLYTRARVALGGLLALNRDETMYYLAHTDSAGQPLRSRCRYRVTGTPPGARWWSITAYSDDFFLFDHPERRYSVNGATVRLDTQGRFSFVSGPTAPAPTRAEGPVWLPTPGDRGLYLTLRLYNPSPQLQAAPTSLAPPVIERLGSCE